MFRSIFVISSLFSSSLFAGSITIRVTVAPHAQTQMKMTHADISIMKQDIYLKTNHKGLTISLTDSSYGAPLMNAMPLSTTPMSFSDNVYYTSAKVGELVISQEENGGSLGITISVK